MSSLHFQKVTFTYPSSTDILLREIDFELFPGWYGLTGNNGTGKTTLMKLAGRLLLPDSGRIAAPTSSYCPQITDELPPRWEEYWEALYGGDNGAGRLFSLLGLDHDWPWRWATLSQGERKRFQLALLLWAERDLLLVDEPTNHLDGSSRLLILEALRQYKGIGLMVSHDRDFMDALCKGHLFLRGGRTSYRPGTLTACLEQEERERQALTKQRGEALRETARLERIAGDRRRLAEGSDRRVSKGRLDPGDHDGKGKIDLARVTGKDGTGGKLLKQMENRIARAEKKVSSLTREGVRKTGVTQSTSVYRGDRILHLPEGSIELGDGRRLKHGELILGPGDRIALSGDNGTGKTTLIGRLIDSSPRRDLILYLPQEIDRDLRELFQREWDAAPAPVRGALISYFSRLGGDPDQFLSSRHLSPGEERKLYIARGLMTEPALIVLDEPTNHLDLASIAILEEALARTGAALLLVSHDGRFRRTLTRTEWRLRERDGVVHLSESETQTL